MFTQEFFVGRLTAYRDELTFARKESARAVADAQRGRTLDWAARLVFRVEWDKEVVFLTDPVDVHNALKRHPGARVSTMMMDVRGSA